MGYLQLMSKRTNGNRSNQFHFTSAHQYRTIQFDSGDDHGNNTSSVSKHIHVPIGWPPIELVLDEEDDVLLPDDDNNILSNSRNPVLVKMIPCVQNFVPFIGKWWFMVECGAVDILVVTTSRIFAVLSLVIAVAVVVPTADIEDNLRVVRLKVDDMVHQIIRNLAHRYYIITSFSSYDRLYVIQTRIFSYMQSYLLSNCGFVVKFKVASHIWIYCC